MRQKITTLPIEGGKAGFDSEGVRFEPWFSKRFIFVPWSDILFVSPIPGIKRTESGWVTYDGIAITAENMPEKVRFYELSIILRNRHVVLARASFLVKVWVRMNIMLKALFEADDELHPSHGVLKLRLSPRKIRKSFPAITQTLDIIQAHSKFDLLCTSD